MFWFLNEKTLKREQDVGLRDIIKVDQRAYALVLPQV